MLAILFCLLLTATINAQVVLDWNICPDATLGYRIYRSDRVLPLATVILSHFTDGAVTPGQSYSYAVTKLTAKGESAKSAPLTVTAPIQATPAPAPCVLKVTGIKWPSKQTGSTSGTWNANQKTLEAGFKWNPLRFEAIAECGGTFILKK